MWLNGWFSRPTNIACSSRFGLSNPVKHKANATRQGLLNLSSLNFAPCMSGERYAQRNCTLGINLVVTALLWQKPSSEPAPLQFHLVPGGMFAVPGLISPNKVARVRPPRCRFSPHTADLQHGPSVAPGMLGSYQCKIEFIRELRRALSPGLNTQSGAAPAKISQLVAVKPSGKYLLDQQHGWFACQQSYWPGVTGSN